MLNKHIELINLGIKMFKKIWNYVKERSDDWNHLQKELNDMGVFTVYHQFGATSHYIDLKLNTHINTTDDKLRTIPNDTQHSKE
tara:strand:+ start:969 stop:1220 length:252 start_codon:yes stop_codon:yes gene_type:complete